MLWRDSVVGSARVTPLNIIFLNIKLGVTFVRSCKLGQIFYIVVSTVSYCDAFYNVYDSFFNNK